MGGEGITSNKTNMGLFDFFKKKPAAIKPSLPGKENTLEIALRKAATEPAFRPEFYKALLAEKLFVITDGKNIPEGETTLKMDTTVKIASLPDGKIPVFSSTQKIFEKGIMKKEVTYLSMKGRDLFNLAKGATFTLNPYSDYRKELLPNEVERLLNGTILDASHKKIEIKKETTVQIGQPAVYPSELVSSLKVLFGHKPNVSKAYLAWIYNPSSGDPPHYIIAVELDGDRMPVFNEAGFIANQILGKDQIIDFMQLSGGSGIEDYFINQTTPFYIK